MASISDHTYSKGVIKLLELKDPVLNEVRIQAVHLMSFHIRRMSILDPPAYTLIHPYTPVLILLYTVIHVYPRVSSSTLFYPLLPSCILF